MLASQGWCSSPSEPQSNALCRQGQGSSRYVPPPFQPSIQACLHWRSHSFFSHWTICDATGHRNPFATILVPSISFTHSRVQGRNLASRLLIAKDETVRNCFNLCFMEFMTANERCADCWPLQTTNTLETVSFGTVRPVLSTGDH